MKRPLLIATVLAAFASSLPPAAAGNPLDPDWPFGEYEMIELVDPFIGTSGGGFVFPGPAMPFGMVQLSPDTDGPIASYTGYAYQDQRIRGFSHVHTQSMGVPSSGEVPVMPTTGAVSTNVKTYQSNFSKASERAHPGFYGVTLDNGVEVELTAGLRTGLHKYRFAPGRQANIIIDAGRTVAGSAIIGADLQNNPGSANAVVKHLADGTVVGTVRPNATGNRDYTVHFALRTSAAADSFGVYSSRGGPALASVTQTSGVGAGAYLSFEPQEETREISAAVGISFVDIEGAIRNLESDVNVSAFDFAESFNAIANAWSEALNTVRISSDDLPNMKAFATALYHAQHHPNIFTDVDGRYKGMDQSAHLIGAPEDPMPAGSEYYANFSMWDTYRTQMPLLAWIQPDRYVNMMRSLHAASVQGGRLPHWGWQDRYADFMNGNPALPVIADGICRGLLPNDLAQDLYEDARRMALPNPYNAHRDPVYLTKGYVPADNNGGSFGSGASSTLEYATNDFSLALVADALGHIADRDKLLDQSENWKKVFDPETRFMRPRNGNGAFVGNPMVPGGPYMPELPNGWREGTGWQYTWLVPHDPAGLLAAIGPEAESRMDTFFSLPALMAAPQATAEAQQKATLYGIAYYGNQYAPSNEHDLQAPWLYAFGESPWKTEAAVNAYRTLYRPTPDGLPGNDDLGSLSAWFVWSALGLYPVQAGAPVYTMVAPMFPDIKITPAGSQVSTKIHGAHLGAERAFVQKIQVDGGQDARFITQRDLEGATVEVTVGAAPALDRARIPGPPSSSTHPLAAFDCAA